MNKSLLNKVALVTGGSRGIGRAITERLLAEGARVATCGRSARPRDLPADILYQQTDVGRTESVQALIEAVMEAFGGVDILVNNAGVQIEKPVSKSEDEDWDRIVDINMKGVFLCSRAVLPILAARGGGSIINIGSISGHVADRNMALYNASKAFVHGLTRSIALDHGAAGIRCNAVAPGWIMTEMADSAFALADDPEKAKAQALRRHPVGRFGQPEDIAAAVAWLASDESAFVSGQVITVDGGMTAASPLQPGLS